ncbi:hypothetical protein Nmel_009076 [Mimus melanotis]
MEKQKRGLKNSGGSLPPLLMWLGSKGWRKGSIVCYPSSLNSPQDTLQLSHSHLARKPPGGRYSHLFWS